jgi:hypothetical protein
MEYMAAAVTLRLVPSFGTGAAFAPWKPESFNFSTPRDMATS